MVVPKKIRWYYKNGVGNGQCVDYAKIVTGINYSGDAWYWKNYINSQEPRIGSIVVLSEGRIGHLGVVIETKKDSFVLAEQNYGSRFIVSSREVSINYKNIIGYVAP